MTWPLRPGSTADAAACHAAYVDAIRNGTAPFYTPEQAMAWAPSDTVEDWLPPRLADGTTWLAEAEGAVAGFLTSSPSGHMDLFFVRPRWRGTGLATTLYDAFAAWADGRGVTRLTTNASHLARRFLEPRGWTVVEGETAVRNGVELKRWKMARPVG